MLFSYYFRRTAGIFILGAVLSACGADNAIEDLSATELVDLVTLEDTPLSITISGSSAVGGTSLYVKVLTPPAHGTFDVLTGSEPLTVTYTPDANWSGTDSFTYQLTTPDERSEVVTGAEIIVTPVPDPPVFSVSAEGYEDTLIPLNITASLVDSDGSEDLSTIVVSGVPEGTFLSNGSYFGSGVYSLTTAQLAGLKIIPEANLDLNFFITLEANSTERATGETALTTLTDVEVFIIPVADAPVPVPVPATAPEDGFVDILLDATDVDHNDDPDTVGIIEVDNPVLTGFSGLDAGSQVTHTDSSPIVFPVDLPVTVRYVPAPDRDVTENFEYIVTDDFNVSANGAISISITPSDDAPTATPQNVSVSEDSTVTILIDATDPDTGDSLQLTALPVMPASGVLTTLGGAPLAGALPLAVPVTVRYTSNPDVDIDDSFDFTVTDSTLLTSTATVSIDVIPVADAPRALGKSLTLDQDTFVNFTLDGTDPDTIDDAGTCTTFAGADGDIRILSVSTPLNGAAITDDIGGALTLPSGSVTKGNGNGLAVRYTPNASFFGEDFVTFTVQDRCGLTHNAVANFTVNRVPVAPVPPVAANFFTSVDEDSYVLVELRLSTTPDLTATYDPDLNYGDTVVLSSISTPPGNGEVRDLNGNPLVLPLTLPATVRYVPDADFNGLDGFSFDVTDTEPGATVTGSIDITVSPVNDAPVFTNLSATEPYTEVNCATGDTPVFQADGDDSIDAPGPWALTYSRNGGSCTFGTVAGDGTVGGTCPVLGSSCTIGIQVTDGSNSTTRFLRIHYNTRHVATVASGAANGSSWSNAMGSIQSAVDSLAGVPGGQVWVKRGTYRSTGTGPVVNISEGIQVYGGFTGTELNLGQRPASPVVHTVLTGDTDSNSSASTGDATHVVFVDGDDTVLDGFIVTRGYAAGSGTDGCGAGVLNDGWYGFILRNIILRDNVAEGDSGNGSGAGLCVLQGEASVQDSRILSNSSNNYGGGIYAEDSELLLERVTVSGNTNTSFQGGAMYGTGSYVILSDTDFRNNSSWYHGGAIYSSIDNFLVVLNSDFTGNVAGAGGPGFGGAINAYQVDVTIIINSSFSGNSASSDGGALYNWDSGTNLQFINSVFWGNTPNDSVDSGSTSLFTNSCTQSDFGVLNLQLGADPFLAAASGELFLDPVSPCVDTGDDSAADMAFGFSGNDWRNLTTNRDTAALDVGPVDPGSHRPPNRVWIRTFVASSPTQLNWTTNAAASCALSGGVLSGSVAVSTIGPYTPGGAGTYTLTCQGQGGPVTATQVLP